MAPWMSRTVAVAGAGSGRGRGRGSPGRSAATAPPRLSAAHTSTPAAASARGEVMRPHPTLPAPPAAIGAADGALSQAVQTLVTQIQADKKDKRAREVRSALREEGEGAAEAA